MFLRFTKLSSDSARFWSTEARRRRRLKFPSPRIKKNKKKTHFRNFGLSSEKFPRCLAMKNRWAILENRNSIQGSGKTSSTELIMSDITAKDLFDAGVHVGHQVKRWNPKSRPFVYDHRHGISVINLEKTLQQLEKSAQIINDLVAGGRDIWFVGTKPQAQDLVRSSAQEAAMPFCATRWPGGTLTNFTTINRSLQKYKRLLKMEEKGEIDQMPNKEASALRREMQRMNRNFEGLLNIEGLPGALFVIDIKNEATAVKEAKRLGIPVIAIADTNTDPTQVSCPIPGNDDSVRSLRILLDEIVGSVRHGLEQRELRKASKTSSMTKRQEKELEEEIRGEEETGEFTEETQARVSISSQPLNA